MKAIEENVNDWSDRVHKSVRKLQRQFQAIGMTPKRHIENNRLSEMLSLFESTSSLSLEDIALKCGYKTYGAFQQTCIRRFDMSPRKLLKEIIASEDSK